MKSPPHYLSNYGDVLAIPLFALLTFYFYGIENKSYLEYLLYAFAISGFILDSAFTYTFFSSK